MNFSACFVSFRKFVIITDRMLLHELFPLLPSSIEHHSDQVEDASIHADGVRREDDDVTEETHDVEEELCLLQCSQVTNVVTVGNC